MERDLPVTGVGAGQIPFVEVSEKIHCQAG
jgi:hypothetical protein